MSKYRALNEKNDFDDKLVGAGNINELMRL